jgi:starvation-inducible outer membrane lipoprotein
MNALKPLVAATLVVGLSGCASQPTEVAEKKAVAEKECLRETGSRIKPRKGEEARCLDRPGRVYTAEEIENSGATSVGEVLRDLGL